MFSSFSITKLLRLYDIERGFKLKNVNRYLQTFCSFLCRGIGPSGTVAISGYIYQHCCNIACLGLYIAALWQY